MIKAKRIVTIGLQVIVDEVAFETLEQADELVSGVTAQAYVDAVETYLTNAFPTITMPHAKVEIQFSGSIDLEAIDEENEQAWNALGVDADDELMDQIDAARDIGNELGVEWTVWSADYDALINNEVLEDGYIVFEYAGGWGDEAPLQSKVYHNPTFRDVWLAADHLVGRSNDRHHIFIENAEYDRTINGIAIYTLIFGS